MRNLPAILLAATFFLWPAVLNGYPIVYSDTGGFLEQALMPDTGWDKPWIYGPFLTPFHAGLTLWPAIAAQAVILSWVLWLTQAAMRVPRRTRHLVVCGVLAAGSAAPWFASLLMPDIFAPITVLGLFALGFGRFGTATRWALAVVLVVAIASHLAHLVLAAGCIAAIALLLWLQSGWRTRMAWRAAGRTVLPLLGALGLLLASNAISFGRLAISPYGSVFALARMVADGPAADVIRRECPAVGWRLCGWVDRLPKDSDDFLWDPNGPVWAYGYGPLRVAPEAAAIVRETVRSEPLGLLVATARNTARQLGMIEIGDVLIPTHLGPTVRERLQTYFPAAEVTRFDASLQARGLLEAAGRRFNAAYAILLLLGGVAVVAMLGSRWRNLAAVVVVGVLVNATATGALSRPNYRYQARIAWLVLVPPLLAIRRPGPARAPAAPPPPRRAGDGSSVG